MPNLLLDIYYPLRSLEAELAEKMFEDFLKDGFSYDRLSNNPDYLVYPSSHTLAALFPQIIKEMLARNDEHNFLIYGILLRLDPTGDSHKDTYFSLSCHELKETFSHDTVKDISRLFNRLEADCPIKPERFKMIRHFWGCAIC